MSAAIRTAREDEAGALSALALRSKAWWGYDEGFLAACRAELSVAPEAIAAGRIHVLADGERLVGFHGIEPAAAGDAELSYLFVEPGFIGQGHGRRLLTHAIAHARAAGHRRLIIQGDPNAKRFYLAAGAVRAGTRASESVPGRALPLFVIDLVRGRPG